MLNLPFTIARNRNFGAAAMLLLGLIAAYIAAGWILSGDTQYLTLSALAFVGAAIFIAILKNWRSGFYFFIAWLLFEDLVRKYLGNNMVIYFAKDVLVGIAYLSFFLAVRRQAASFKPKFLLPLFAFFWLAVLQVFNPSSPHLLYGALGLKVYFYYVPLLFVGYALLDEEKDLHKFLVFNLRLAVVIAVLGIIQAIRGPLFLNPVDIDSNLRTLSTLHRYSPISHLDSYRPNSVFVSEGRFAWYLILMWLLGFGAAGYLLLRGARGRYFTLLSLGVLTVALALHGSRGGVMWTGGSALVAVAAFLWGAPWKQREGLRIVKAIRNVCLACGFGLILMISLFPEALGARFAFYSETLSPNSPAYELSYRVGEYPLKAIRMAFETGRWPYGYGIGTSSLGAQYVAQWTGTPALPLGLESGFATLVVEFGVVGLALWFAWTVTLLLAAFRVVRGLKGTVYFPIAFAIFWFAFLLLLPLTYAGMPAYQNFVFNAYLWLLLGILFRLPYLASLQTRQHSIK